jgi:hypothetical protein
MSVTLLDGYDDLKIFNLDSLQTVSWMMTGDTFTIVNGDGNEIRYCLACQRQVDGSRPPNERRSGFGDMKIDFYSALLAA